MLITDIRVRHLFSPQDTSHLRAFVSVTFDNMLAVHDIRVIEKGDKMFVSMPSAPDRSGKHRDIVHPINSTMREQIETAIIARYKEAVAEAEEEAEAVPAEA